MAEKRFSLTSRAPDDTPPLVDRFQELANDERHRLNPLHLLLCSEQFSPEVVCLIADVLLPIVSACPISWRPRRSRGEASACLPPGARETRDAPPVASRYCRAPRLRPAASSGESASP